MKLIRTEDAVGQVLCHDMTQIIRGVTKDARFRKGHIVTEEDIPVLLSMGKENIYVFEKQPGWLHEDEAAERLRCVCQGENIQASAPKEGKIGFSAACDGLFRVDKERLFAVNDIDEITVATIHNNTPVKAGAQLAGTRVVPLVIDGKKLDLVDEAAGPEPLMQVLPYTMKTAAVIATGSEILKGRIEDTFTPVVIDKLKSYGIETLYHGMSGDDKETITAMAEEYHRKGVDIILCTGGMSVDPDDRTPAGIRATGAEVISYGAPVLPGAMFLLAYFADGTPILGLPGCVMFCKTTIFDLILPRLAAGVRVSRRDIKALGHGGFCLSCPECRWPVCPFGKGD